MNESGLLAGVVLAFATMFVAAVLKRRFREHL
jgi:hypothetical protein